MHFFDLSDRDDYEQAIVLSKFLDNLPQKKWLRNPVDLKRKEIENAARNFPKNSFSEINPFVNDFVDSFEDEPFSALENRRNYRGASIEKIMTDLVNNRQQGSFTKENIQQWANDQSVIINETHGVEGKNRKIEENLRRVLKDDIARFKEEKIRGSVITNRIIDIDEFVSWLINNSSLTPSIWLPYYTQHHMFRDKKIKWSGSHLIDLAHLAVLPYVDYLSVDRQIYAFAMQAFRDVERYIPVEWKTKLIKAISKIKLEQ